MHKPNAILLAFVLALTSLVAVPLRAADARATGHPAMWTVHGQHCTIYLLGSVHVLPAAFAWRDDRIDQAIASADTFMFEVPVDVASIQHLVAEKASLPPGTSLLAMLPPAAQDDLNADLALVHLPESAIDSRRPWFVSIVLSTLRMTQGGIVPPTGVDLTILGEARARGKPVRYLETVQQQLALLVPSDPKLELESFAAFLRNFRTEKDMLPDLLAAWAAGDVTKLAAFTFSHLADHPDARKTLVDDRNRAWIKEIEPILESENGTFLITVGALHLLGDAGVPELLRADGYKVYGP